MPSVACVVDADGSDTDGVDAVSPDEAALEDAPTNTDASASLLPSPQPASPAVARLCESARINKKTFYRYYDSLDDLLAQVQHEFADEYVELTGHLKIPGDAGEITRRFILYSCETGAKSPFYEAVTCSTAFNDIRNSMIDSVLESRRISPGGFGALSAQEASVVISFLQQTGINAYRQWVADGKRLPAEQLASLTADLVEGALERVLRQKEARA